MAGADDDQHLETARCGKRQRRSGHVVDERAGFLARAARFRLLLPRSRHE